MKRITLMLVLLMGVINCLSYALSDFDYFEKGQQLFEQKDLKGAREQLIEAVKLKPTDPIYRNWLGSIYYDLRQYNDAIAQLEQASQLGQAWNYYLGMSYLKTEKINEAKIELEKALSAANNEERKKEIEGIVKKAENYLAYYSSGSHHLNSGKIGIAKVEFERAQKLFETTAVKEALKEVNSRRNNRFLMLFSVFCLLSAGVGSGIKYARYKDIPKKLMKDGISSDEREKLFKKYLKGCYGARLDLNIFPPEILFNIYINSKNYKECLEWMVEHRTHPQFYTMIAWDLFNKQKYEDAQKAIKTKKAYFKRLDEKDEALIKQLSEVYISNGDSYFQQSNFIDAISEYNKAIEIDRKSHIAYNKCGMAYLKINKRSEAKADFKKSIKIKPDYSDAYKNLGILEMGCLSYSDAIDNFNKALKINPNDFIASKQRELASDKLDETRRKEQEKRERERREQSERERIKRAERERQEKEEQERKARERTDERRAKEIYQDALQLFEKTEVLVRNSDRATLFDRLSQIYSGLKSDQLKSLMSRRQFKDFIDVVQGIINSLNKLAQDAEGYHGISDGYTGMSRSKALKILGLQNGATQEQIRQAWKDNNVLYHPDKNRQKEEHVRKSLEEFLKEINLAYKYLKNNGV